MTAIALTPRIDQKTAKALVDLPMQAAIENALQGLAEPSTYDEHAVLVGWPPAEEKERIKQIKVALAKRSSDCYSPHANTGVS